MENIIIVAIVMIIIFFLISKCVQEEIEREKAERELNEYKTVLEKEIKELKTINKILEEDKKDKVHISHCEEQTRFLKIRILELKGYNRRSEDSEGYIFYEHGEDFKIVALWNYAEKVFELDQEGEIFPTREMAEKSLLEKLEKEELVKNELKEKYAGYPKEKIIKCGTTTEEACKNAEEYTKVLKGRSEQKECANKVKEDLDINPNITTGGAQMFYMGCRAPEYITNEEIIVNAIKKTNEEEIDFANMSKEQLRVFLQDKYGYCNGWRKRR